MALTGSAKSGEYKDLPEAYELEERSRPDEMAMLSFAQHLATQSLNDVSSAAVLDLCCGTGLSFEEVLDHPSVGVLVGIDISPQYLAFARNKFETKSVQPMLILGDAVTTPLPPFTWDVVMMASAYHHIEDSRKLAFLRRVRALLGTHGIGIIAENILPEYSPGDRDGYARSIKTFYDAVLETARSSNPYLPRHVEMLIQRVAQYGYDGEYEYKVSYSIFLDDLSRAGLRIVQEVRVWPLSGPVGADGGNYVFVVVPDQAEDDRVHLIKKDLSP